MCISIAYYATIFNVMFRKHWKIWVIVVFGLLVHLVPFFYSKTPLGYDMGFYRRYLVEGGNILTNVPGLGSDALIPKLILKSFSPLGTDLALYGSYILIWIFILVLFFKLAKNHTNERVALVSTLLFSISAISFLNYWYFLYKGAVGILFVLMLLRLIEQKSTLSFFFIILLGLSHQTTSILFMIVLFVDILLNKTRRKYSLSLFTTLFAIYIPLHGLNLGISLNNLPVADFVSWFSYLAVSLPLILLASAGFKTWYLENKKSFLFSFGVVAVMYPIFHLPFYERIFIFTDIFVCIIAGIGFVKLYGINSSKRTKNIAQFALGILLLSICIILLNRISVLKPLISPIGISELQKIDSLVEKNSHIITSTNLAPFVLGYSHAHTIAPGMLSDTKTIGEWSFYWNEPDQNIKYEFLKSYPSPLYIFIQPELHNSFVPSICSEKLSSYLTKIDCRQTEK